MKPARILAVASAALALAFLAGCSTPDSRIRQSPAVFARLNPDQQALVRAGQIAIGFDKDAVRLALGDPERITEQTSPAGTQEVWHYITYEDAQGVVIYGGYWHRYRGWGGPRFYGDVAYYNGYPVRVHERLRVVFDLQGRVILFEQEKP